jgi:hypothetical protein
MWIYYGDKKNSGSVEEKLKAFSRLKDITATIAKAHVGLWEILFLGIIMQHILVKKHPQHRKDELFSLRRFVHSRAHIYACVLLLGTMSIDLVFDLPIIFGGGGHVVEDSAAYKMSHVYYQRNMPSFVSTVIIPCVVIIAFAGIIIQGMMIQGEDTLLSRLCLVMMIIGGGWYRAVEFPLEKEFPFLNLKR